MDLIDLIESHRFLGTEFLMWLWYKSDVFEGRFMVGERACEVWFDDKLTLEAVMVETEQSVLKGASPTFTPEAREALRQGKMPTQAKLRLIYEGKEFQLTLKGAALQMSGIKLPALMTRSDDEKFYERMFLLELLEELMEDLYTEFVGLRLTANAWDKVLDAVRAWIKDGSLIETDEYNALKAQVPALKRVRSTTAIATGIPATGDVQEVQAAPAAEAQAEPAAESAQAEPAAEEAPAAPLPVEPAAEASAAPPA